jgi:hypothetical protein
LDVVRLLNFPHPLLRRRRHPVHLNAINAARSTPLGRCRCHRLLSLHRRAREPRCPTPPPPSPSRSSSLTVGAIMLLLHLQHRARDQAITALGNHAIHLAVTTTVENRAVLPAVSPAASNYSGVTNPLALSFPLPLQILFCFVWMFS